MKLETEYIPIEQLNAWDKNPRLHNLDSIIESIKEFGFRDPISINENNSEIEEGHGRLKALKKLKESGSEPPAFIIQQNGTWLVPVQRFNDTELNQKRYSLAHNRTQELGGYDEPLLLENLIDLKEDLFATGYTSEDIDLLNEKMPDNYGTSFILPNGDKAPFQQMTFTLADKQAELIQNAMAQAKKDEQFDYCETFQNENSNGNALYFIVSQWAGQRK